MPKSTGLPQAEHEMPVAQAEVPPIVQIEQQEKSNWCWAAVTSSIVAKKDGPSARFARQCELAVETYSHSSKPWSHAECCDNHSNAVGNSVIMPAWIAGQFGFSSPLSIAGIAQDPPVPADNSITDKAILDALRAGKPVCIVIHWNGGADSHFVAIVGAMKDGSGWKYAVGDPAHGTTHWLSRQAIANYHSTSDDDLSGTWGETFVTI